MVNRGQYAAATALGAPRVEAGSQISYMRNTGDAFGFGAASRRLGLTPYQAAERMAYLSTRSNMGTLEGLQNFANRYFGGNLAAAREFMSYMNESGALARWRALANVARQTGIAPGNASDREAGMAMFNYLQTASVKDQYGDSYRLNNLLADLSNQTGLSQTEILRRMAGARGFTFTDRDGSVKTMKFDGNGNAVIARSEKGIPGPTNLGDGVVMQSGVVRTEGVGDNMVTTYSGVFSYTGRDGKQHTLEGSVAMDSKGNVVSIQGAGGAQVSDAVKEDFMNAFKKGTSVDAGYKVGDFVQLLQAYQRGEVSDSQMASVFRALDSNDKLKQDTMAGIASLLGRWKSSQYTLTKGTSEQFTAGFRGGLGIGGFRGRPGTGGMGAGGKGGRGFGLEMGVSAGKTYGASEGNSRTGSYNENMLIASQIVNRGLETFKSEGAGEAAGRMMKDIKKVLERYRQESAKTKEDIDAAVDDVKPIQVLGQAWQDAKEAKDWFGGQISRIFEMNPEDKASLKWHLKREEPAITWPWRRLLEKDSTLYNFFYKPWEKNIPGT
ncbi:MAG TPA: hypothetical protein ENJ61_03915 [Aquifex aeolicus]|uniref:Uncharacterized protein n=1 Tax=Aquifex aeolicus TaxID=63363 RepID=A0A7C5Q202_AQUAO|nr:hypothetical protein [Aquifex aeolicus]